MMISPYQKLVGYAALDLQMSEHGEAFLAAATSGDIDTVQKLLKNGGISAEYRGRAFVMAAEQGNLQMVQELHKNGSIPENWHRMAVTSASSRSVLSFFNDGFAITPN